jgi:hypothetical protein
MARTVFAFAYDDAGDGFTALVVCQDEEIGETTDCGKLADVTSRAAGRKILLISDATLNRFAQ